jgi:hypothetical protein
MAARVLAFYLLGMIMAVSASATIKEYVALAPNAGGSATSTAFEWVAVEYPTDVSSAKDVTLTKVSQSVGELGSWYGLDPGGVMLTAKIYGDNLYAMMPSSSGNSGGCCSDRLRIYPRNGGGKYTEIKLDAVVQDALGTTTAHASHTFDVTKLPDGTLAALFVVRYTETGLSGAVCDAIVGINLADGSLVPTASGAKNFNLFKDAGTTSSSEDARYKIMFSKSSGTEEWHGNGVQRFTSSSGVTLLAHTHRFNQEAVIFKDPFTYKEGGGEILQRFGTPSGHHFGVEKSASSFTGGVHNVWYTPKSQALGGVESISLFVNSQDGKSQAYEFALSLKEQGSSGDPGDDTVFATKSVHATCSFTAGAQGGTRTIGNGVFLVTSGIDATGLEVADVSGNTKSLKYSSGNAEFPPAGGTPLYDPFIRVIASSTEVVV